MLGNQNLSVFVQANGTLRDVGGGAFYTNRDNRLNYGVGVSHIPSRYGQIGLASGGREIVQFVQRIYRTQVSTQVSYPLSQTNRFELSLGGTRYGFDTTVRRIDRVTGQIQESRQTSDPLYLTQVGLAYVGDFSSSGLTSPLQGGRYRFQVTPQFGSRNFVSVLADWRRYFYREPFTFAFRGLHQGNYGANAEGGLVGGGDLRGQFENLIVRETLGDPYNTGFVRGYSFSSFFDQPACRTGGGECGIEYLYGTRMALASAEVRVPLLGPEVIGLSTFEYVPVDLVLFGDAGVAWTSEDFDDWTLRTSVPESQGVASGLVTAEPVTSAGLSARVNLLGAIVFEMFYARTFQRDKPWDFGLILRPGW
jgi:hypothetical protein